MKIFTLSIVTVSYNCLPFLKQTIDSIVCSDISNCQYIIVDGASTDGTRNFLNDLKQRSLPKTSELTILSEPDGGIYEGMNKGINLAKGKYILFMNAGDFMASPKALDALKDACSRDEYDIIYGDTHMRYRWGTAIYRATAPNDKDPMPFIHQSVAVKTELLKRYGFDVQYRILADHDLFNKLYKAGCTYQYLPIPISSYYAQSGFSADHPYWIHLEHSRIHGLDKSKYWPLRKLYLKMRFDYKMRIHKIIPKQIEDYFEQRRIRKLFGNCNK